MTQVANRITKNDPHFLSYKSLDYHRPLVISLGTGSVETETNYTADLVNTWGLHDWLIYNDSIPVLQIISEGNSRMVDYHMSVVFPALHAEDNYLRIQVC